MTTKGTTRHAASAYPQRPPFFAQRVIRAMTKTAAAQSISATGFALVALIAAQEDAKRYTGPVAYFNSQLSVALGIRKWETLDAIRTRAVEAGWLHYNAPPVGSRMIPAVYWTLIPIDMAPLDDSPCDESDVIAASYRRGFDVGYSAGQRGEPYPFSGDSESEHIRFSDTIMERSRIRSWNEGGYGRGEHSILSLIPNPDSCSDVASTPRSEPDAPAPGFDPFDCVGPVKTWALSAAKLAEWQSSFPDLDVAGEIRKARQWLIDNPRKRKTARGMVQFLSNWLQRSQNVGRGAKLMNGKPAAQPTIYKPLAPITRRGVSTSE